MKPAPPVTRQTPLFFPSIENPSSYSQRIFIRQLTK
jgi:hypothetical protein